MVIKRVEKHSYRTNGVFDFRQYAFSPIVLFVNWRISTSFSPIGKYRADIRQLANILWRNKNILANFPSTFANWRIY